MDIKQINAKELSILLQNDEVTLIDVREPDEYINEHIASAINIPLSAIISDFYSLDKIGQKKIVIMCRAGTRSAKAITQLKDDDCDFDLWNLEGGLIAWKDTVQ